MPSRGVRAHGMYTHALAHSRRRYGRIPLHICKDLSTMTLTPGVSDVSSTVVIHAFISPPTLRYRSLPMFLQIAHAGGVPQPRTRELEPLDAESDHDAH
ncbi:hypothetical protein C8Q74DRAFT_98633 [Fomes fomentarius]|nr:hypothetical protein C8Q74DRAFT_98633 [Fomes fomentarius]